MLLSPSTRHHHIFGRKCPSTCLPLSTPAVPFPHIPPLHQQQCPMQLNASLASPCLWRSLLPQHPLAAPPPLCIPCKPPCAGVCGPPADAAPRRAHFRQCHTQVGGAPEAVDATQYWDAMCWLAMQSPYKHELLGECFSCMYCAEMLREYIMPVHWGGQSYK
jgi:hypothetical protein